jgi:hypothetical protein
VRATEVYQDIGHDNCTCLFVQPSELDQKLKDVLSAGKQVVVAAKAAEQDYIAEAVEHAFKGVEKQGKSWHGAVAHTQCAAVTAAMLWMPSRCQLDY